jgi:hypothetical protein
VRFVSQINNKPIQPPYIELADFESYAKQKAVKEYEKQTLNKVP